MYLVGGALVVGLTVGLLGAGGSMLTVPVLKYVLHHDDKQAIAESLAIVGAITFAAMTPYARSGLIHWRSVVFFGLPGVAGTYLGAWSSQFVSGPIQLTLFSVVVLAAAWFIIRSPFKRRAAADAGVEEDHNSHRRPGWTMGIEGLSVGAIAGLVGVGGGFMIVPALVSLGRLPIRRAIGTALIITSMASFGGFIKYYEVLPSAGVSLDWHTILVFAGLGAAGSWVGKLVGGRLPRQRLQQAFAGFLIVMGLFVMANEAPRAFANWHGRQNAVSRPTRVTNRSRERRIPRVTRLVRTRPIAGEWNWL